MATPKEWSHFLDAMDVLRRESHVAASVAKAASEESLKVRQISSLNPQAPWPFDHIKPESEREFLSTLPEATF